MSSIYHTHLQEYLSPDQIVFIEMLLRVIQVFKEIKIEKLAGRLPIPIKFESRRRAIQRFLRSMSIRHIIAVATDYQANRRPFDVRSKTPNQEKK